MAGADRKEGGFSGLRVLALESRRAREMAQLISNNGGVPVVAPSTREVPAESNAAVVSFVSGLLKNQFDVVIFLTGVGTRALAQAAEPVCPRTQLVAALSRITVVARGPKPVAVLRELGVPITFAVPEPNTWREILQLLDQNRDQVPLKGQRVAVQEYGVPNPELVSGLAERGAQVFPVHVYNWSRPEDLNPLRAAITSLARNEIDAVLFTSSVQLYHLLEFADEMKLRQDVLRALGRAIVGSIGPVTSEALRSYGVQVDLEPSHPKMGLLVKEVADQSQELMERKRRL